MSRSVGAGLFAGSNEVVTAYVAAMEPRHRRSLIQEAQRIRAGLGC